jgi:hypothetical protein
MCRCAAIVLGLFAVFCASDAWSQEIALPRSFAPRELRPAVDPYPPPGIAPAPPTPYRAPFVGPSYPHNGPILGPEMCPISAPAVRISLMDGSSLVGTIVEPTAWKLSAEYGEFSFSPKKIAGVYVMGNAAQVKVLLTNSDTLTGKLDFDKLRLKAAWGEVTIEARHILVIGGMAAPMTNFPPSVGPPATTYSPAP